MGTVYRRKVKDKQTGKLVETGPFWIQYYQAGKKIRESANTDSITKARSLLKDREGDVVRGKAINRKAGKVKFHELAEDLVTEYEINGRKSLRDLEARNRLHILPVFGECRASEITTSDISRFVLARQDAGASNAEINRELASIKRAFTLGMIAGKALARPHIPMLKENNVRTGFFEPDQFAALKKKLPVRLQNLALFAYITGWRKSEITGLQWPQVDFKAGFVRLEPGTTKNEEAREFPLTADLRRLLEEQRATADALARKGIITPWVFFGKRGQPVGDFKRSWGTASRKAGLPGRIPHDFRRTAVRNLVRAGVPERVAMKLTGHKTRSVFERYNIVSGGDLTDAARKLDTFMGTISGTVAQNSRHAAFAIVTQPAVESGHCEKRTRSSVG